MLRSHYQKQQNGQCGQLHFHRVAVGSVAQALVDVVMSLNSTGNWLTDFFLNGTQQGETKTYDWLTLHFVIGALNKVDTSST